MSVSRENEHGEDGTYECLHVGYQRRKDKAEAAIAPAVKRARAARDTSSLSPESNL